MSETIVPVQLDSGNVTVIVNPLDPAELWVEPFVVTSLDRVRPLLPEGWQSAPVHRFEPTGPYAPGAWVLRRDVPKGHTVRTWGTDTYWCDCSACDAYRSVRLSLCLVEGWSA